MSRAAHPSEWGGPEYDAYLIRVEAQTLAKLGNVELAPAIEEIEKTVGVLEALLRRYHGRNAL
jgi:hypothetical protein